MICKCCGKEFRPAGIQHRLLCGDSTNRADVERLMAGEKASMVFTDPPYNVDYEGYTEERLKIKGDRMTAAAVLPVPGGHLWKLPPGRPARRLHVRLPLFVVAAGIPERT